MGGYCQVANKKADAVVLLEIQVLDGYKIASDDAGATREPGFSRLSKRMYV